MMDKFTLKEAEAALGKTATGDAVINEVCTDTRKITPGCLFICLKGERFDAHDFAAQAAELGAAALMVEHPVDVDIPCIIVENTGKAMLELSGWYRSRFSIPVVGLTGSVGKTTTKEFIALVLGAKYKTLKTQGNLNNEIGVPQMLFRIDGETEAAVIEMGMNHKGEIHRLTSAVKPTIALITNIGTSHIENLGSRQGILNAKLEILDSMEKGSTLLINSDNDMLATVNRDDFNIIRFAIDDKSADYTAVDIAESDNSTSFTVCFDGSKRQITVPTVGRHNVYNALAAFAVGREIGIDADKAAAALANYVPAGMRQRSVDVGNVHVIEDCYNASPDSMNAALTTLAGRKTGKKIAVLADMLELGDYSEKAHKSVGEIAAKHDIDIVLAYGEYAKFYVSAAKENGIKSAYHFETKEELADKLLELTDAGDNVLFKGSRGMRLEDIMNLVYKRWEKQ